MTSDGVAGAFVQRIEPGRKFWNRPEPEGLSAIGQLRRKLRPVRRHTRQFWNRQGLRWRYHVLGHRSETQLFIVAEGRTGSNLIVDYLSSVPGLACTEEVLNETSRIGFRRHWRTKGMSLRHIAYSVALPARVAVAKLPPTHLHWHGLTCGDVRERFPAARFVILYRKNLAKQYVSWCRLFLTGEERVRDDREARELVIHVDGGHFREFCQRVREKYEQLMRDPALRGCSTVLSYEELAADPQGVFNERIFPLLDVRPVPVSTKMKKQSSQSLEEAVANYADVAELFNSPEAMLDLVTESPGLVPGRRANELAGTMLPR